MSTFRSLHTLVFLMFVALATDGCAPKYIAKIAERMTTPKYVAKAPPTIADFEGRPPQYSVVLDVNGDGFEDYISLEPMRDAQYVGTHFLTIDWGLARFDRNTVGGVVTGQHLWIQGVGSFKFVRPPYHPNGYWLVLTAPSIEGEVTLDLTVVDIWKHASLLPQEWVKGFPVKPALAGSSMPACMRPQQVQLE